MWGLLALSVFLGCALLALVVFVLTLREEHRALKSSSEERTHMRELIEQQLACIEEDIRVMKYRVWARNRRAKK